MRSEIEISKVTPIFLILKLELAGDRWESRATRWRSQKERGSVVVTNGYALLVYFG
ncbi:hypothetical protein PQG02_34035 (plasmid) [Nostoc sp. UHCC 0926]|uniref:hypothetical protein n=1 Tax=Nostoc sp. UHCC 0926 TaxID=3025190 RepID=UPI00235EE15D|nr:hypothetical protein [Nostoc sp. UHCC 0926]WDD36864.1 hypothetical protein PQG02_34035 [Nostoc sp. UHCC 0926]